MASQANFSRKKRKLSHDNQSKTKKLKSRWDDDGEDDDDFGEVDIGDSEIKINPGKRNPYKLMENHPVFKKAFTDLNEIMNGRKQMDDFLKTKRNAYYCYYCNAELHNRNIFAQHIQSRDHVAKMEESLHTLGAAIARFYVTMQDITAAAIRQGKSTHLCRLCLLPYPQHPEEHIRSTEHQLGSRIVRLNCNTCRRNFSDRIDLEKHRMTLRHVRNHFQQFSDIVLDSDLDLPEIRETNNEPQGMHYVYDTMGFYCDVCKFAFRGCNKELKFPDHCCSEHHYRNYKAYLRERNYAK